jgi:hypothetical protein
VFHTTKLLSNLRHAPEERKRREELSYQCPVICFASVQCSKDAYDLMDKTVMPTIKLQLLELQRSSLVTVYHTRNMRQCFRSYMVPSSICPGTMAFMINGEGENRVRCMTFAHGGQDAPRFGLIDLVDPIFNDVPHFQLGAKVTVSSFNELFIGNLAFLAMLIGMNNSSGSHCLVCLKKGSEFNCNHKQCTKHTKETLEYSLEQYNPS